VDRAAIEKKKPRVIVDCNGSACVITPYLLSDLGCKVVSVNASTVCFNRPSEPAGENVAYLSRLVSGGKADFAIAHDGDGDRCVVIDDTGQALPFDVQLAIMIEHELLESGNRKVVSTVEASLTVREVVENAGGSIYITPVGSTFVGDKLEESGALFGGEPCGEYIYGRGVHVPDAVLAAAKFAEIFCKGGAFSKLKARYKQHYMAREKFRARDKHATMAAMKTAIVIEGKMRSDDGIRIDEQDGWLLVRASGTEPVVRLTMEYTTKEKLERRREELSALIRKNSKG
jgi:phosphoglucosamine mutase